MAPALASTPLGVYVHVPFCAHICPYCDFNTFLGQEALIPRYVAALAVDLERRLAAMGDPMVGSIYFGGGTPSLLEPAQVGHLIAVARAHGLTADDVEITLEANPTSVDQGYFERLLAAGVNRLSLGVQTTDRRGLRTLGRQHEATDARAAFIAARAAGFANISLDLIFGWPGQTLETWRRDLDAVLTWNGVPDHLSLYSLILEPGTPMADAVGRGILRAVEDDLVADMYELAREALGARGYNHYEISNWARSESLASRHNLVYWRNADYLGIGAGAHGQGGDQRAMNHLLPLVYMQAVERGEDPVSNREALDRRTRMGETMMLGLRLVREGVEEHGFRTRFGVSLGEQFGPQLEELARLGMIERRQDRVRLTPNGVLVANDIVARFL